MLSRSSIHRPNIGLGVGAALIAAVVAIVVVLLVISYAQTSYTTFTLTSKESVSKSHDQGGGHEYHLYTDNGTYKVTDSFVHWRHNSSDVYGRLMTGHRYTCKVYGWRIPLMSKYKNVLNCEDIT